MIAKAKALLLKYREGIAYLFFGGLATLLNIVLAMVFRFLGLPTTVNTVLDNILCILFAYVTNRLWVFCSSAKGMAAVREFVSFVTCRLGTLVLERQLEALLGDGELLSRQINSQVEGDTLLVTLTAECEEQIGKFVEIPKE